MIADRLKMVSLNNSNRPAGVAKPIYVYPTFPLTTTKV